jgi:PKD repeat protein
MDAPWRLLVIAVLVAALFAGTATAARTAPLIVDHSSCDLSTVPASAVAGAKATLHIAYGHTSHGSQLVGGMSGLTSFAGAPLPPSTYAFNEGGIGGALDLDDYFAGGDLGNPDFSTWASLTRTYLDRPENHDVNVVMWSWCGEVSGASEANINTYLSLMDALERDYPSVTFVYMTGHLDGSGVSGNLNLRNNQIRDWCRSHNRVLYDFADIESYDPDGNGYLALGANDACGYSGGNWAQAWQNSHTVNVDWYTCDAAHTEPLNANQKAYAAWHLFARLAGWNGASPTPTPARTPAAIPGVVEAEDYAPGGEGAGYHDTTPGNSGGAYRQDDVDIEAVAGGYAVAYIRDGEWLAYSVVANRPAACRLSARVASPNAMARVEVLVDGAPAFTIAVPNTGGYEAFSEVEAPGQVPLTAGAHTLTVRFPVGLMNLDRVTLLAIQPVPFPAGALPLDTDGDGLYDDTNGNGRMDFADVVLYFNQMSWIGANEPVPAFDCNGNGRIDFADVVWLFTHL